MPDIENSPPDPEEGHIANIITSAKEGHPDSNYAQTCSLRCARLVYFESVFLQ